MTAHNSVQDPRLPFAAKGKKRDMIQAEERGYFNTGWFLRKTPYDTQTEGKYDAGKITHFRLLRIRVP